MLLGTTYYYTMHRDGRITRLADMDSCGPCRAHDSRCEPHEIRMWVCENWDGRREFGAGQEVRRRYRTDAQIEAAIQAATKTARISGKTHKPEERQRTPSRAK